MGDSIEELSAGLEGARDEYAAMGALEAIRVAAGRGADVSTLVPAVLRCLRSVDDWVVESAVETLGALGDARAVSPLCALLPGSPPQAPDVEGGSSAAYAAAAVANEGDTLRHHVIRALEALGSREAVPSLQAVVDAPWTSDANRAAARRALAALTR